MSVSTTVRKVGFNGNGIAVAFPFAFKVFQQTDVLVVLTDNLGNQTTQTLTSQYLVSLNAEQDTSPGGTVTMVTAPPTGYTLTIGSQLAALQSTVLTNTGGFFPTVLNNALDYLTILVQQIISQLSGVISFPFSDPSGLNATLPTAAQRANTLMAFDASGNVVQGPNIASVGTVTSNIANINAVAGDLANINAVAGDLAAINNAPTQATNAANSATAAANSASAAATAASVGTQVFAPEVSIASAATTAIGGASSMNILITGITAITAFDTVAAGIHRNVRFAGALTLTNSAALVLPGGANITTAANDCMEVESLGSGNWIVRNYAPSGSGSLQHGPAFRASASATQTLAVNVSTKIQFNTKIFDTANAFDATTNYRFQPLVAGYYQVTASINLQSTNPALAAIPVIFKNGSVYESGNAVPCSTYSYATAQVTSSVYLNGSTDYVEAYGQGTGASGSNTVVGLAFQAVLTRSA